MPWPNAGAAAASAMASIAANSITFLIHYLLSCPSYVLRPFNFVLQSQYLSPHFFMFSLIYLISGLTSGRFREQSPYLSEDTSAHVGGGIGGWIQLIHRQLLLKQGRLWMVYETLVPSTRRG